MWVMSYVNNMASATRRFLPAYFLPISPSDQVGVVFLDQKKTFVSVSHDLLIAKLPTFALSQASITWFRNYLFGRHQNVTSPIAQMTRDPGSSPILPLY